MIWHDIYDTVTDSWDRFFTWLFKDWGPPGTTYWSPNNSGSASKARVDAALARAAAAPPAAHNGTRPPAKPAALNVPAPQPTPGDTPRTAPRINTTLNIEADSDWCTCNGLAGRHRRRDHQPDKFQIDLPAVPSI